MTSDHYHHVAGDIEATTALAIGTALANVPHSKLEISSEVAFAGDNFDFAIYPSRRGPQVTKEFLVGGNIWLPLAEARALLARMCAALHECGIAYALELEVDQTTHETELMTNAPR